MTEPRGVWVYAVAERAAAYGADRVPGVGGNPVRVVVAAGLAAVAEDVPLDEFGESALRRHLEDLSWLETAARAHHRVINAVAELGPVVPMRLATIYRTDAGVAAALSERAADFREALRRTAARQEWGVKVYAIASAGREGPAAQGASAPPGSRAGTAGRALTAAEAQTGDEALTGAEARAEAGAQTGDEALTGAEPRAEAGARTGDEAGTGAAYLRRRQGELTTQRNARRSAAASAEAVHDRLCGLAAGSRLYPPQAPQLTGGRAQMILNAAYLVDDERGRDFAAAVTSLATGHPDVRLELTGPWPPYSFAGAAEEGNAAGAADSERLAGAKAGPRPGLPGAGRGGARDPGGPS